MKRQVSICLILLMVFLLAGTRLSMAVDDSLVLYLTFDEDQGKEVNDLTAYGNDGDIKGNPKVVDGIFGFALEFNGSTDSVEIPHSDSLTMSKAFTIEMWVNLASPGKTDNQVGMEKGGWESGEYGLYVYYVPGDASAVQIKDVPEACGDANSGNLGQNVKDGNWHHLTGMWNGKEIFLYTDGVLDMSVECSGTIGENSKPLYIAARNGGERFLMGIIDEVRLYNRALSEDEIKKDMETFGKISVSPLEKLAVCWGTVKVD